MASELIALRLPPELKEALRARAEEQGTNVSELIRRSVELYLGTVPDMRVAVTDEARRSLTENIHELFDDVVGSLIRRADEAGQMAADAARDERRRAKAEGKRGMRKLGRME